MTELSQVAFQIHSRTLHGTLTVPKDPYYADTVIRLKELCRATPSMVPDNTPLGGEHDLAGCSRGHYANDWRLVHPHPP
jgi:hypothetical protein